MFSDAFVRKLKAIFAGVIHASRNDEVDDHASMDKAFGGVGRAWKSEVARADDWWLMAQADCEARDFQFRCPG